MNIALPAGTLLLLLLPGLLLVHTFLGRIGRRPQEPAGQSGFTWHWLIALILAPFFHVSLSGINTFLGGQAVDHEAVFFLLAGDYDDTAQYTAAVNAVMKYRWYVSAYFLEATLIAICAGTLARFLVRGMELDRKFRMFRFGSDWHYFFWGELEDKIPGGVIVVVSVESAGKCYLYMGSLENFTEGANGELLRLHLTDGLRRNIENDRDLELEDNEAVEDTRFYPISGDELVIMGRDIHTICVQYLHFEEAPEDPGAAESASASH